jgi:hypothetical protein
MKNITWLLATVVGSILVSACAPESVETGEIGAAEEDGEQIAEVESAVACPDVSGTNVNRSLVVTNPAILAKFSFQRTMDRIRTTAQVAAGETTLGIYQTWMKTFTNTANGGSCDEARVDPNNYDLECQRFPESLLAGFNPFSAAATVKFAPVGLFNRFDLAPANGANCGEYRIVYAMEPNATLPGRAFIIFEAVLPNPNPAAGVDACLPVAQFWQSLTSDGDVNSRAAKLEKFYFTGGAVPGFAAVVNAAHYGLATNAAAATAGQIRTNFFILNEEWQLREFKLRRTCTDTLNPATCGLEVQHVTVKTNPAEELFSGTHSKAATFQPAFLAQVKNLDAAAVTDIMMAIANQYNEWESQSHPVPAPRVLYRNAASAAFRADIDEQLAALGSSLTATDVLERATTQTCAGCHDASNSHFLGKGQVWPSSLGFVHINENGALSPALTGTFLPRRKVVLEKFINDRCSGVVTAFAAEAGAAEGTIGGSMEGAAN